MGAACIPTARLSKSQKCSRCVITGYSTLPRLPRISVRTLKRCVFLQADRPYRLEVFGFDRFQTASFLAPGTHLQDCVLYNNVSDLL